MVSIFGFGEPLIDKGIVEKVEYCSDMGLRTFITTNGALLDIDLASKLIEAGLTRIRFSVHGVTQDSYETVHRGLKFKDTTRNIFNFLKVNDVKYGGACRADASTIPMMDSLEDVRSFWTRKIDNFEVWKPHNWVDGEEFRELSQVRKKTCGRPSDGPIQINWDGKVMVCCFDYDAKMTVGDTTTDSLESIILGDAFNEIRARHDFEDLKGLPCETCDQLNTGEKPLLYSTMDDGSEWKFSSTKIKLKEI